MCLCKLEQKALQAQNPYEKLLLNVALLQPFALNKWSNNEHVHWDALSQWTRFTFLGFSEAEVVTIASIAEENLHDSVSMT